MRPKLPALCSAKGSVSQHDSKDVGVPSKGARIIYSCMFCIRKKSPATSRVLLLEDSCSQSTSTSPGTLLEMHILDPRPTASAHLGKGPSSLLTNSPPSELMLTPKLVKKPRKTESERHAGAAQAVNTVKSPRFRGLRSQKGSYCNDRKLTKGGRRKTAAAA